MSAIEHKAVLAAAHAVCHLGGREVVLPVDRKGHVLLDALDAALAERPAVVSIMWVNNEVGVVQPVAEIAVRCRDAGVVFHTDAVQAFGKIPVSMGELPCTLLTLSGHKIGAPEGHRGAVVRDRKAVEAIIHGGGQQYGIRPGTENVAGAVALGRAALLAAREQAGGGGAALRRCATARQGPPRGGLRPDRERRGRGDRAPHVLNVSVAGADSEALLMHLDLAGIAASSGSACSTGSVEPSHVLVAMGVPRDLALGAIRFSLGRGEHDGRTWTGSARGDAGGGGEGAAARRTCWAGPRHERGCWWRCRAASTARWPPRAWSSRATRWSAPP